MSTQKLQISERPKSRICRVSVRAIVREEKGEVPTAIEIYKITNASEWYNVKWYQTLPFPKVYHCLYKPSWLLLLFLTREFMCIMTTHIFKIYTCTVWVRMDESPVVTANIRQLVTPRCVLTTVIALLLYIRKWCVDYPVYVSVDRPVPFSVYHSYYPRHYLGPYDGDECIISKPSFPYLGKCVLTVYWLISRKAFKVHDVF